MLAHLHNFTQDQGKFYFVHNWPSAAPWMTQQLLEKISSITTVFSTVASGNLNLGENNQSWVPDYLDKGTSRNPGMWLTQNMDWYVNPGKLSLEGLASLIWCLKSQNFNHRFHLFGHGLHYSWNMIVRWNNFVADSVYINFIMGWLVFVVFCLSWTYVWSVFMQFRLRKFLCTCSLCV